MVETNGEGWGASKHGFHVIDTEQGTPGEPGSHWRSWSMSGPSAAREMCELLNDLNDGALRGTCDADIEDLHGLLGRMSMLLHTTATALKGEPEGLGLHSFHDLPEVALQHVNRVDVLEVKVADLSGLLDRALTAMEWVGPHAYAGGRSFKDTEQLAGPLAELREFKASHAEPEEASS